jgi:hypothetical protein
MISKDNKKKIRKVIKKHHIGIKYSINDLSNTINSISNTCNLNMDSTKSILANYLYESNSKYFFSLRKKQSNYDTNIQLLNSINNNDDLLKPQKGNDSNSKVKEEELLQSNDILDSDSPIKVNINRRF